MTASAFHQRRTQAQRRAASEAALLRAAAELIAERGFERTSLRGIGARAGTSRAMPAYHFGSKEALVAHLVARGQQQTLEKTAIRLDREGRDFDDLPRLDALRITIESFLEVFAEPETPEERAVVVMWGATFPSESPLPTLVESDRAMHRDLVELIRDGQRDGSIRAGLDPDAAALMVMGMARGAAALSLTHPDLAERAAVRQTCSDAIADALGVKHPAPRN